MVLVTVRVAYTLWDILDRLDLIQCHMVQAQLYGPIYTRFCHPSSALAALLVFLRTLPAAS